MIVGRSLVVGKPVSMMLLKKNATITVCHTKTKNIKQEVQAADIVVAAAGSAGFIKKEHLRTGQVVIDVGINVNEKAICAVTVAFDEAEPIGRCNYTGSRRSWRSHDFNFGGACGKCSTFENESQ